MIANDSSGARVPIYGTTADHVASLEIVLADGRVEQIGREHKTLRNEHGAISRLIEDNSAQIAEWMPPGMQTRWPGYGIGRFLRFAPDLNNIMAGSEGTLAAIFSAKLKILPLPARKNWA